MSTRLDLVLQKHPEHEEGIRMLASRDPSGNLKYLDWGVKILASKQALAPEIADILDLFHRFRGSHTKRRREQIRSDIYSYRPQDLANLRDNLLKLKRATDKRRRKRERLYRIEGEVEADTVYESHDLIVRHIKNKNASVHYGLGTKWCISMLREGHFENYETHNATFFFFERKAPLGDEFDKVALTVPRNAEQQSDETAEAFTTLDQRVDMMRLAKVYGSRVFDIFREIHERSERYPGSAMFQVFSGSATQEQIEATFIERGSNSRSTAALLRAICCNGAAPQTLLEEIVRISVAGTAEKRRDRRRIRQRDSTRDLTRDVMAAVAIHPNAPADVREKLIKDLRRRHVITDTICLVREDQRIAVSYDTRDDTRDDTRGDRRSRHFWRYHRRPSTVKALRARARMFDRLAARTRKKARTLQRKLTAAKAKKKLREAVARSKQSTKRAA